MRYFLDTEFIERGPKHPIELVSLALVAEDGSEMYWVNRDFDSDHANDWVREHVLPNLVAPHPMPGKVAPVYEIAYDVFQMIGTKDPPEFWGYYAAYDWVAFCQIFGDMVRLPTGWPYYCRDLKQLIDERELTISQEDSDHNALADARWVRDTWISITAREGQ